MSKADLKLDIPSNYFGYFPNPTKDYLNLKWGEIISSYAITDLRGRTIKTLKNINQKEISIDVQNMKTGIYFLELLNNSATNRKVVKFVKK
ncbi:T9SS type A sorting domain-containing protein [Snuella sedimenti]|nr:T9SS type A sorting domain-containing protein [Snuella sedimenti]